MISFLKTVIHLQEACIYHL